MKQGNATRLHNRLGRLGLAGSACALLAVGCSDTVTEPARTDAAAIEAAFGRDAVEWFTADDAGAWLMHPLLDSTKVFFERDGFHVPGGSSRLLALDRARGTLLWERDIIAANNAAIAGDVVGAIWGGLPMFERTSGAQRGVVTLPGTSLSGNVVSHRGHFLVGSHDGRVLAIESGTAAPPLWTTVLAGGPRTTTFGITVTADAIAATLKHFSGGGGAPDSSIIAVLEPEDGRLRWRAAHAAFGGGYVRPAVVAGDLVIAVDQRHDVRAFDIRSGALRWERNVAFTQDRFNSDGISRCDGRVIVATGERGVAALDAATGDVIWRAAHLREGSPRFVQCLYGSVLILGSGIGMEVLDAATGQPRARYPIRLTRTQRPFYIASVTRDETSLYVGTTAGFVRIRAP